MPGIYDRMYARSPVWLQNLGVSAYGLIWRHRRFGGDFPRLADDYRERERFSAAEWDAYQTQKLRLLLAHACAHVPYYRRRFGAAMGYPDFEHFSLADLPGLPILTKEEMRRDPAAFLSDNVEPRQIHFYHTSGTTGTPLAIGFTNRFHRDWSAAYEARVRSWAGVDRSMSRAMIGGRLVVPRAEAGPPFWRYNLVERQLYLSAFHISPANARHYAAALNHYRPDYLVGYASSHFFLARLFAEGRLTVHHPKAVLTSSEKLTNEMRTLLEKVYDCPVFDAYSGVEACCLASECEHHRLHISPDVGVIELVDDAGQPVQPGQVGNIVATGLLNNAQPLIRFWTGDLAVIAASTCACGRQMMILEELVGRLEDTVIGRDGREMVRFHGIFVGLPHIRAGQVIQESLSDFRLRLEVDPDFNDLDRAVIRKRFEDRLGPIRLTFEVVPQIELTQNGKFRAVISHVHRSQS